MVRTIIHVDMDAFFASVEQRDDPTLRGKPVLVGGPAQRGVVAAASYEARKFGIHSAMPMAEALRRCPHAVVVGGKHRHYGEVSQEIFDIFRRYTPMVEGLSLDEAFLDVTASHALFGDGETIARRIKSEIRNELKLVASAGVATCKFAAKIASDLDKPDGLVIVPADLRAFLAPMPVERMWGIGPVTAKKVHQAGWHTIGDLAAAPVAELESVLGSWGREVHSLAHGEDSREVVTGSAPKSIGAEDTYAVDLRGPAEISPRLLSQAKRVAQRLTRAGLRGRTVTLKIKYSDFSVRTTRLTLDASIADTDSIFDAANKLLERIDTDRRSVRLTGISVSGLQSGGGQGDLFVDREIVARDKIESLTDAVRQRFGDASLTRASLIDLPGRS